MPRDSNTKAGSRPLASSTSDYFGAVVVSVVDFFDFDFFEEDFFDFFAFFSGFGVSVVLGEDVAGRRGTYGWDGGMGTVWRNDPARRAITILLSPRMWPSPQPPPLCVDFWSAAAVRLGA